MGAVVGWQANSDANVANAVPLGTLVQLSDSVVVATVTGVSCHYETIGDKRRMVTDTTLQVDHSVSGNATASGEVITVRTLGGTIGDLAQVILGEAVLAPGSTNLLFLRQGKDGLLHVSAMAQGEYVVAPDQDGQLRLRPSPGLDVVVNPEKSAVTALAGRTLDQAESLVAANTGKSRQVP